MEDDDPYHGTPPDPEDPTYAIGDYVWIDSSGDGLQDDDEDPLEDVTVVLYDGEGEEVSRTATDEDGRYIFDELDAGDYQVQFVLTEEQVELYEFTSYTSGDNVTGDSNAGENGLSATITLGPDNEFLTADEDYDYNDVIASAGIDPTWDAGVVLLPEETPEPTPSEEPSPSPTEPTPTDPAGDPEAEDEDGDGSLARTGFALGGVLLASLALLFGGLLMKQWNDRRRNAEI